MRLLRRTLLKSPFALPFAAAASAAAAQELPSRQPPLNLRGLTDKPVKIASVELLRRGSDYFVRTRSADGAEGLAPTKQIELFIPIFLKAVAPVFIGRDARDLEALIDEVYVRNYKMAGQPLWCPVAYVEQSLLDMLGKIAGKPVGELLGGVLRREIPVYLSGSVRTTTAEEEVDVYVRGVQVTGAQAVKLKIGGRMSRNADASPGRTERMIPLARKRLADRIILYADANGSYDSTKAIEIGRMLQELKVAFFEEPCPWEEKGETKRVADALDMPVAFGEQDSSLWLFEWMIENRVMDIVQPDINYSGGLIRASHVARMARRAKMSIVPHNTQTGASAVYILQFASATPNVGPFMEFPWRGEKTTESWYSPRFEIRNGKITVPPGSGLGLQIDPDYLKSAEKVDRC